MRLLLAAILDRPVVIPNDSAHDSDAVGKHPAERVHAAAVQIHVHVYVHGRPHATRKLARERFVEEARHQRHAWTRRARRLVGEHVRAHGLHGGARVAQGAERSARVEGTLLP